MKRIIETLKRDGEIHIGLYRVFLYDDGEISVRREGSGLMGPCEKPTLAGLGRILKWMDVN